jgi:hypothetical protein
LLRGGGAPRLFGCFACHGRAVGAQWQRGGRAHDQQKELTSCGGKTTEPGKQNSEFVVCKKAGAKKRADVCSISPVRFSNFQPENE